ncbi:DUF6233 domain-containing protein [Streptomyces sp. NBC_00344]|uniref:DUF6233 domain-containing protein n=1 Tax=Streptomyces sp. NBC_00344 TaxID=2975720 RepID=UPI002E1D71EC
MRRFQVGVPMWRHEEAEVIAVEYRVWVSPEQLRPLEGVRYDQVPIRGLPPDQEPAPAGPRWGWRVVPLLDNRRRTLGQVVHVHDCTEAEGGRDADLDEALDALRRPGGQACQECAAAEALLPLQ